MGNLSQISRFPLDGNFPNYLMNPSLSIYGLLRDGTHAYIESSGWEMLVAEGEGPDYNEGRGGKVIVHCMSGINRSGLIAIAACMVLERMPLLEAVRLAKIKRGNILTNESFRHQLCDLAAAEDLLGDKPTGYSDEPIESTPSMNILSF